MGFLSRGGDKSSRQKSPSSMSRQERLRRHEAIEYMTDNIGVWSRSRSAADITKRQQQQQQSRFHHHQQQQQQQPPSHNEFYRISRRRIIGTAIRAEERNQINEEERLEFRRKRQQQHQRQLSLSSNYNSSDADLEYAAETSKTPISRHRSADPVLRGWVPLLPNEVMQQMKERKSGFKQQQHHRTPKASCLEDVTGMLLHSEEEEPFSRHRLKIPVSHPNFCTCVANVGRSNSNISAKSHARKVWTDEEERPRSSAGCNYHHNHHQHHQRSVSQGNLMNIQEEESSNNHNHNNNTVMMLIPKANLTKKKPSFKDPRSPMKSMSTADVRTNKKVTEERLLRIASYHHLPRVDPVKLSSEEELENNVVVPERKSGGRFLKNKRQRNRTLTLGALDEAFPLKSDQDRGNKKPAEEKEQKRIGEDSSLNSDPGICLQFTSSSNGGDSSPTVRSTTTTDDSEEVSDVDSLEDVNLKLFDQQSAAEAQISLALVEESATVHRYIASRGQREREEEIYEVLPATIEKRKKTKKKRGKSSSDDGVVLI